MVNPHSTVFVFATFFIFITYFCAYFHISSSLSIISNISSISFWFNPNLLIISCSFFRISFAFFNRNFLDSILLSLIFSTKGIKVGSSNKYALMYSLKNQNFVISSNLSLIRKLVSNVPKVGTRIYFASSGSVFLFFIRTKYGFCFRLVPHLFVAQIAP